MIGGVDTHMAGDIGKLTDLSTPDFAIDTEIGIVVQHSLRNTAARADLGISTELATVYFSRFVNSGSTESLVMLLPSARKRLRR